MAGCGSYFKLEGFAFLLVTCFAMVLATFVGQNLGAQKLDRVKKGTRFGILCSIILSESVGVIIFLFSPIFLRFFSNDESVIEIGIKQAHTEALFYCFLAFSHCIAGILRGAGKALVPMNIMLVCWCLIRVTYITVMTNHFINQLWVVYSGYPLTWILSSLAFFIYYKKADWIHNFNRLKHADI